MSKNANVLVVTAKTNDGKIKTKIILNTGTTQNGLFGINLHKGGLSSFVDRWSAGCLVVPQKHWELIIPHFYNGEQIDFNLIS